MNSSSVIVTRVSHMLRRYRREGATLQIGGSDQWGNITAGTDLVLQLDNLPAQGRTAAYIALALALALASGGTAAQPAGTVLYLSPTQEEMATIYFALGDPDRLRSFNGGDGLLAADLAIDADPAAGHGELAAIPVEFPDSGPATSESIHQYGASNRPSSPHHADQARSFTAHRLKPTLRDPADLARKTERRVSSRRRCSSDALSAGRARGTRALTSSAPR